MTALNNDLCAFLDASTSPWHAVAEAARRLESAGFTYLDENSEWQNRAGAFYTTRNASSLIAWRAPKGSPKSGIRIVGSHTDSPNLRLKPNALYCERGYWQLGLEVYGGALLHPWFDRDLSFSGRVITAKGSQLVDLKEPIAVIPSLAIHLQDKANSNSSINAQLHLPALLGSEPDQKLSTCEWLGQLLEIKDEIIDFEIGLYDTQPARVIGLNRDLIASARLDNLLSFYTSLSALIDSPSDQWSMIVSTDHEEVGSASHCGAAGPFLHDTLARLSEGDALIHQALIRNSILISADNAHALHPNYADKHDPRHAPLLNGGLVIKVNANQRYATNATTSAMFKSLCNALDIPVHSITVRADMRCGSTIGPITSTLTGLNTVDVGIAQLAMHSVREVAGLTDCTRMIAALTAFFTNNSLAT